MAPTSLSPYEILTKYVQDVSNPPGKDFNLSKAIGTALQGGNIPSEHIAVMVFTKSLLQFGDNDWVTCTWLVKQIQGPPLGEGLATLLFPRSEFDKLKGKKNPPKLDILDKVRVGFFQVEPLVAMKILLDKTRQFSLTAAVKTLASCILDAVISKGLELDSSEILVLVVAQRRVATDNNGKLPDDFRRNFDSALTFVKILKNLSRIAQDPEDMALLYRQKWQTIRRVATEKKKRFTDKFVPLGMTMENALALHNAAQRIDCWNEHFWLTMMEARRGDFIPVEPQENPDKEDTNNGEKTLRSNNLTDIFQLEDAACETCCSITSLSAYFADLMSLLKQTESKKSSATLFGILNKRRPDLKHMQLTCANSQTLIPYISLVNEVLESYIHYNYRLENPDSDEDISRRDTVQVWNTPEDAQTPEEDVHSDQPVYQPGNTIDYIYSDIISKQMYPFTHFPYEKPRDEITQILGSFKVHMPELIEAFRMRQDLLSGVPKDMRKQQDVKDQLQRGINEVFARQNAAEVLGIQQAEFSAITGETFFPSWFVDLLHGLSDKDQPSTFQSGCSWTAATLWGYKSTDEMVKATSTTRLSLIKAELMKRSGLEFQDILDLAKSQCFGQDLVITNENGSGEFENSLEDLLLLASSSEPPFKDLTEDICFNLQAFLRLQAKLKWTTRDLDATIFSLRSREMEKSSSIYKPKVTSFFSISPYVFKGIASIVKLSELTGIEPASLLPLWGAMDTYGDKSFIYRKFFTPVLRHISKIFEPPKNDMFLTIGNNSVLIRDEDGPICMSLGWPVENYVELLQVIGLDGSGESLDVDKFSTLYRHVLICRILQVSPKNCKRFFRLFFAESKNPLDNPAATLSAINKWKRLLDVGWTVDSLHNLLNASNDAADAGTSAMDGLRIISAISQGVQGIRNSFPFLFTEAEPSSDNVAECAARTFDAATAKVVVAFVKGIQVKSTKVSFTDLPELNKAIVASSKWPKKLQLTPDLARGAVQAELSITGTLTAEESKAIENLSAEPASLKQAIGNLREQALVPGDIIRSRFEKAGGSNVADLIKAVLGDKASAAPDQSSTEDEKELIKDELLKRERQSAFVKLSSPTIIQELMETLIYNTVQGVVPDLDTKMTPVLLSNIVQLPAQGGKGKESALIALQRLSEPSNAATATLDAYFTPNATDIFTLSYLKKDGASSKVSPNLTVNGVLISFDATTSTWTPFQMASGQTYHLAGNFPPSQLLWSTPKSMTSDFTDEMLLPAQKAQTANNIVAAVKRVAGICRIYQLTVEELDYFGIPKTATQRIPAIDFNAPTFDLLAKLQDYVDFKGKCKPVSNENSPISLLLWLSRTTGLNRDDIVSELVACTGWNRSRLLEAINVKYEDYTDAELLASLRNFDELLTLQAIMSIDNCLALAAGVDSQPSMYNLFYIAKSRYTLSLEDDEQAAHNLRARLTLAQRTAADQGLMENQRKALVAYLLQQDYIKALEIHDADGLFEYFLIDVQMGPQLRTSRIKQAVSVVQLFAQRSLLGLEKEVPKTSLVREQWEWRQQYSLWEAHVKMFLYPENWLEPSLRDDKSQLFDEFEASLMKKNLSLDTFTEAIKTYVYGLNQIASLEVVSYIRELSGSTDIFHLFGRTRASPHTFHHRTLTVLRAETAGVFWRPWTKIEMDIPSVETEWEGKRLDITGSHLIPVLTGGRLYLFIPQISPKSTGQKGATAYETKKFGDLATTNADVAKPKRVWEITMAWTELSRGTWTPKRVATGSLTLETVTKPNELRFEPKFDAESRSNKVTLVAGYPYQNERKTWTYEKFGGFSFCEDQMISLSKADVTPDLTDHLFNSTFQQETIPKADITNLSPGEPLTGAGDKKPYLWLPQALADLDSSAKESRKNKSVSWTLSYGSEEGPTSLVLSAQRNDGTSISYFNMPKKSFLRLRDWKKDELNKEMDMVTMDHTFSHTLMRAAAVRVEPLRSVFNVLTTRELDELPATFGEYKSDKGDKSPIYHELAKPTALYNWEIGLHSVLLAMDRFFATQQFEEALQVARLVFDPTVDVQVQRYITDNSNPQRKIEKKESCWRFPPFQDIARKIGQKRGINLKVADIARDKDFNLAIMERRTHGALVHATARGRPEAYMKWIVMKYVEVLIAAGDFHFCRGTLESLPLAIQRYIEASHILGPEPPKIPKLGKKKPYTFNELDQEDVNLELGLPFSPKLKGAAEKLETGRQGEKIVCYLRTTYFCVPLNPKFKQMRSLVNERLFNIRNSLDIQGRPVTYALIEPPIDPSALIALSSQGLSVSDALAVVLGDQNSPLPRQRFEFLLRQAMELCNELRSLGERLLSAVEKKEGETFAALRARHATAIQKRMLDIKNTSLAEAEQTINLLLINRDSQVSQLAFYLALIGEPQSMIPTSKDPWIDIRQDIDTPTKDDLHMSSFEKMEMDMTNAAGGLNLVAAGIDGLVAPLFAVPEFEANTAPMGVGASIGVGGSNIAAAVSAGSTYLKMLAMMAGEEAGRASRKAQLTRQLQERRLQANMRGREIKAIDKQIEIQKVKVQAVQKEIELQQTEIEEATQVEAWYRTKYSNEQLYGWMEKNIRNLYYQAYTLAISMARKTESALSFEEGHRVTLLRQGGYWDASRDGLLSADHLYLDLKRLESTYLDSHHDFEITRTVSLRQINPLALLKLRLKGTATFLLSENLFDTDFPGHYMRRIRSVALSIPAVVGPYSNINATLQLTGHQYRISSTVSKPDDYAAQNRDSFRNDHIPISAVAISSGSHDSGVFELAFSGPKYMPFEGAGAISSWRLDLPEVRKFDYQTISDVLLHIQYTALDGGVTLRSVASETVRKASQAINNEGRNEGFWAMWDLKNDFVNEWHEFKSRLLAGKTSSASTATVSMKLGDLKDRLPFWSRQQAKLQVHNIIWVSRSDSLVKELKVKGVPAPGSEDIKIEPLGKQCTMKTWKNLRDVTKLDGWELTAPTTVLDDKEETVPNVYMFIRYTYR